MLRIRACLLLALGALCLFPAVLRADAIMVSRAMSASTIAEIYVGQGNVCIELEIGGLDLPVFANLMPDSIYEKMGNPPVPVAQRLEQFFHDDFVVEADGVTLPGAVSQMAPRKRLKRDDITGEPLPNQGEGEQVLFAELVFPMSGTPEKLSFKPPRDQRGLVSAAIGMMAYHHGLPVTDFRYLSRKEVLNLDWSDPWYSHFDNKNLRRQYNEPISVFLYAEPFETRVEVIVRPKDIQQWHDLDIHNLERLPIEIQSGLKERIAAFLLTRMELTIDGARVEPQLQRINFLKRTLKSSIVIDPAEELDAISATLGVIYSVPTEALPQEATLTWNLFSPKMQVVRAAATDEAGPLPYKLRPDDNVLVWKNYLKNPTIPAIRALAPPETSRLIRIPVGTIVCLLVCVPLMLAIGRKRGRWVVGAAGGITCACALLIYPYLTISCPVPTVPEQTDEAVTNLISGLLENVYTSFDFREESTIYDALDHSLVGELLTDVYLQTKKSLELASQGGAQVQVKGIDLESVEFEPLANGVMATCAWRVMGSVGHWGHIHQRVNRYRARLNVQPVDGVWKITELEMQDAERVK
jgi:hypothetical protein